MKEGCCGGPRALRPLVHHKPKGKLQTFGESDASENLSKYVAPPANASTSLNQIISGASNAEKKKILAASNAR